MLLTCLAFTLASSALGCADAESDDLERSVQRGLLSDGGVDDTDLLDGGEEDSDLDEASEEDEDGRSMDAGKRGGSDGGRKRCGRRGRSAGERGHFGDRGGFGDRNGRGDRDDEDRDEQERPERPGFPSAPEQDDDRTPGLTDTDRDLDTPGAGPSVVDTARTR